ncbi:Ig-like domain-containing protein [Roseomonas populi]|uniref:Tandem-95 repeat protein n=1 Tax=Roseomonas populi TaxID=3121582 RepID=A0ABT1XC67_9PROT|nr:hypothetical protein [Roseomonas pecuniae]MCR0985725.1 hypothetical protein [Roseomonas pecuniae]
MPRRRLDGTLADDLINASDLPADSYAFSRLDQGNDRFLGSSQDDLVAGGAGDDTLRGAGGNDRLDGNEGNDRLDGGDGADRLFGGAGEDRLLGGSGDDVLNGGAGDDRLSGGTGDDVLILDFADGRTGKDVLDGGDGQDELRLVMTRAEWLDFVAQVDIPRLTTDLANGAIVFSRHLGALVRGFESIKVVVDGVGVPTNDDPVTAQPDFATVTAGDTVSLDVLANDQVPDLVSALSVISRLPRGTATFAPDDTLTFATGADFAFLRQDATFDVPVFYIVRDTDGDFGTALATIRVTGVNDAPTGITLAPQSAVDGTAGPGGQRIGTVVVADPDQGDKAVITVDDARFEIRGDTLYLRQGQALDAATEPTVALHLTATDLGGLSVSSDITLTVEHPGQGGFNIERVGTYEIFSGRGEPTLNTFVRDTGLTPVTLHTLSAVELARVDAVFVTNMSASNNSEFTLAQPTLEAWVRDGGVLFVHGSTGLSAPHNLPGGEGMDVRYKTGGQIEVVDDDGPIAQGPFGVVTDTSLDVENSRQFPYTPVASIRADAEIILTTELPTEAVTYGYRLGEGAVVYSTLSVASYLWGFGSPTMNEAVKIYAENLLAAFTNGGDVFA